MRWAGLWTTTIDVRCVERSSSWPPTTPSTLSSRTSPPTPSPKVLPLVLPHNTHTHVSSPLASRTALTMTRARAEYRRRIAQARKEAQELCHNLPLFVLNVVLHTHTHTHHRTHATCLLTTHLILASKGALSGHVSRSARVRTAIPEPHRSLAGLLALVPPPSRLASLNPGA
jgi:hypothetical protein